MPAQDAEASGVDFQLRVDGRTAGEVVPGELHRRTAGGVADRAREMDAGLADGASRIQDEADGASGDGASIFGREFESQASDIGDQVVEADAFGAERALEIRLQRDFAAGVGHLLAHGEARPGDTGSEVGLTPGVELIAADAEAE